MKKTSFIICFSALVLAGCASKVPEDTGLSDSPSDSVIKEDEIIREKQTMKSKRTSTTQDKIPEKIENEAVREDLILTDTLPRESTPRAEKLRKERAKKAMEENEEIDDSLERDLIEDH